MSTQKIIDVPNYNLYFSLIDKGFTLYYVSLYVAHKVTTKQQVISALSFGTKLYLKEELEDWLIEEAEEFNL